MKQSKKSRVIDRLLIIILPWYLWALKRKKQNLITKTIRAVGRKF